MKHKRLEAPAWVFPWRSVREPLVPKLLALTVTIGFFAILLSSVRIRVTSPMPWASSKAVVIQALDDVEGRALALRACEGGPFPSRFEPGSWEPARAIFKTAYEQARWQPPAYVPTLRPLPQERPRIGLITPGESVLPERPLVIAPLIHAEKQVLSITFRPMSGNAEPFLPDVVPPFHGELGSAALALPWRFLLRLNARGGVLDCVSLTGGDEAARMLLQEWLRGVSFKPDSAASSRWIAVGLSFNYRPVHGTDTH